MGLLQGRSFWKLGSYYEENGHGVFFVADVIFLPVESSKTRVTADDETYTLIAGIIVLMQLMPIGLAKLRHIMNWKDTTRKDIVGWYHSHPSFGCWLSGIDVNTQ